MKEFIRGATVQFPDWVFRDANGDATIPESAKLYVRYLYCDDEKIDAIDLVEDDGVWSAEWDSSEADPGIIFWHIRPLVPTGGPAEGQFRLKANPANPRG